MNFLLNKKYYGYNEIKSKNIPVMGYHLCSMTLQTSANNLTEEILP